MSVSHPRQAASKRFFLFISNPRTEQDGRAIQMAMTGPPSFRAMFAVHVIEGVSTPLLQDNEHQRRTGSAEETMFQIQELLKAFAGPPPQGGAGGPVASLPPAAAAAASAHSIAAQARQAVAREALLRGAATTPGGPVHAPYAGGGHDASAALPPGLQIGSVLHSGEDQVEFRSPGGMGIPGGTQSRFTGGGLMTIGAISGIDATFESASASGLTIMAAEQIAANPARMDHMRTQAMDEMLRGAFAPMTADLPAGKFSDKSLGPAREADIIAARDRHDAAIAARLPKPPPSTAATEFTTPTTELRRSDYVPQTLPF
jgi:hypothetical protein